MKELYIAIDGTHLKVGTCDHCVLREQGRPARAWDPDDARSELDFPLEALKAALADLGLTLVSSAEYVCP